MTFNAGMFKDNIVETTIDMLLSGVSQNGVKVFTLLSASREDYHIPRKIIMEETGLTENQIKRAIADLRSKGWLILVKSPVPGVRSSQYKLTKPKNIKPKKKREQITKQEK